MDTKQAAASLRAQYKAAGWNARMVSVRTSYFSMGSSIRVTVRSAAVDFNKAKAMAEAVERVDRCQFTGEILSGGNRYVSVAMTEACADAVAKPLLGAVRNAVEELDRLSDGTHADVTPVATVCRARWATGFDLWIGSRHHMAYQRDEHGYRAAAVAIATASPEEWDPVQLCSALQREAAEQAILDSELAANVPAEELSRMCPQPFDSATVETEDSTAAPEYAAWAAQLHGNTATWVQCARCSEMVVDYVEWDGHLVCLECEEELINDRIDAERPRDPRHL